MFLKDYEEHDLTLSLTNAIISKINSKMVSNEASGSGKSKKAAELGVQVITEAEFNQMIGRNV